jgi:WD40 repeat protein
LANLEHDDSILSLAFAPGAKLVATGSYDHTARVWDAVTGTELKRLQHDHDVESIAFSADGKYLLTTTDDIQAAESTPPTDYRSAQMWEVATGKRINRVSLLEARHGIAFSPDGRFLAVSSGALPPAIGESPEVNRHNSVYLVDFETGRKVKRFHHDGSVTDVLFNPGGDSMATGTEDGTITVWDHAGPRLWMRHDNESIGLLKYAPNGKYLAAIGASIRVWEARTGREVSRWSIEDADDASFSPDSAYLATRSSDLSQGPRENALRVWYVSTGEEVARIKLSSGVSSFAFSPDGERIALAGSAGQLEVWLWVSKTLIREACEQLSAEHLPDPQFWKACRD